MGHQSGNRILEQLVWSTASDGMQSADRVEVSGFGVIEVIGVSEVSIEALTTVHDSSSLDTLHQDTLFQHLCNVQPHSFKRPSRVPMPNWVNTFSKLISSLSLSGPAVSIFCFPSCLA